MQPAIPKRLNSFLVTTILSSPNLDMQEQKMYFWFSKASFEGHLLTAFMNVHW